MSNSIGLSCKIKTGKLDANAAVKDGSYPFFTCAEHPDLIDHFAFDDDVVLVAGNNANGNFHVNRFTGKFNAYQRTYVLSAKDGVDIDYIYYALKLELKHLKEKSQGSQTKFLTMPILNGINLQDLNLTEQKKISGVLRVIDEKISLNHRINAELESVAKALYEYWFVQYDFPDLNGKPYKSSGGTMVYNDLLKRPIPDGWETTELGNLAELYQPKTISEKEMSINGKYLVYGANGIVGRYDQYNHDKSEVVITCRGNSCGEINITRPFAWITGNAMVVKPTEDHVAVDYLFNLLKRSGIHKVITGSAQPQITRTNLSPVLTVSPPKSLLSDYSKIVSDSFDKRIAVLEENEYLENFRDWLLPLLMNGQVTVE